MSGKLLWFAMLMFLSSVFAGERLPVDDTSFNRIPQIMNGMRVNCGIIKGKQFSRIVLIKKEGNPI